MPNLNASIKTRRKKLSKTWSTKEWKEQKAIFLKENPLCKWCGASATIPHHPYQKSYSEGTYPNLYLSGCVPLCRRCHFALHKGLLLCPKCKEKYMRVGSECCYGCYVSMHPEIEESRKIAKEKRKKEQKEYNKKRYLSVKEKRILEQSLKRHDEILKRLK